jgi:two-component sensor histidine kinase
MQDARVEFLDRVRDMRDEVEIARLASRVIGEALYVCRVGLGDIDRDGDTIDVKADWTAPGHPSLVGRRRYSDFGTFASALHAGERVVMTDARTDVRAAGYAGLKDLGVEALVNLPSMRDGSLKAVLFVNSAEPRAWTQAELGFMDEMFDRTYAAIDRLRSEAERDVLAEEIAHRMKNVLAIAQVIVKQSLRHIPQIEAERRSIEARLSALAGAQDVLTRAEDREADILSVVEATLAPHLPQQGRIEVSGASVPLNSSQVLGLSLALHELATNAAKYGALSNQAGRVLIDWSTDEEGRFALTWTEKDGPEVAATDAKGFGSTVLERIVGNYFSGRSTLIRDPEGIRFEIDGRL